LENAEKTRILEQKYIELDKSLAAERKEFSAQNRDLTEKMKKENEFLVQICANLENENKRALAARDHLQIILTSKTELLDKTLKTKAVLEKEVESAITAQEQILAEKQEIESEVMVLKEEFDTLKREHSILKDTVAAYEFQFQQP